MDQYNVCLTQARLASGELQRARDEQAEMQRLYGAVDWRAKKKLRAEKKVQHFFFESRLLMIYENFLLGWRSQEHHQKISNHAIWVGA